MSLIWCSDLKKNVKKIYSLLFKIKIETKHTITFTFQCGSLETIIHMLWECKFTQAVLVQSEQLLCQSNINLSYKKESFLLGLYCTNNVNKTDTIIMMNVK